MNPFAIPSFFLASDWAIQPEAHSALLARLRELSTSAEAAGLPTDGRDMGVDEFEEYLVKRGYIFRPQQVGTVMVIPVRGVMVYDCNLWGEVYGCASMAKIGGWIRDAVEDRRITGIVLHVDSPGGTVLGCEDLARVVESASAQKSLIAVNAGMMCSAAYYACAGAGYIYTGRAAMTGSVGVILQIADVTKFYENLGVKVETFVSGPLKGTGAAGTSLSEAQREYVQSRVDGLANDFKGWVTGHRGKVKEDSMQGQSFYGAEGIARGFSDGFGTLGDAIRDVERM